MRFESYGQLPDAVRVTDPRLTALQNLAAAVDGSVALVLELNASNAQAAADLTAARAQIADLQARLAAAQTPAPPSTPPAPPAPPTTPPVTPPASSIDWPLWKITTDGPGAPEFYPAAPAERFDADGNVVCAARAGGGTTSGSSYPRNEHREMTRDGKLASWSTKDGRAHLQVEACITDLPPVKPQVAFMQIHDAEDDVIEVLADRTRSDLPKGQVAITVRFKGQTQSAYLSSTYKLGDWITTTIDASPTGIDVSLGGTKLHFTYSGSGLYFKWGAYVQSNVSKGDKADALGRVVFRPTVLVSHA